MSFPANCRSALFIAIVRILVADDDPVSRRLVEKILARFGHAPVVANPSASPAVVPYQLFRELELPRLKRMFTAYKQAGAKVNILYIPGPTAPILAFYPQAGSDIALFDYCVDPLDAQNALARNCLFGNIKSLSFIEAAPEEIAAESSRLLGLFADRNGFVLSSGCETPPESKPENVAAMVAAAKERI